MTVFNRDTFTMLVGAGFNRIMWGTGKYSFRLANVINGLLPDFVSEAMRQVARWTLPLQDTPADVMPYLLRSFGLPAYLETYLATLDRAQRAIDTLTRAGSLGQLVEELEFIGMADVVLTIDYNTYEVTIEASNASATVDWGTFTFGDGTTYGPGFPGDIAHNFVRLWRYFGPANCKVTIAEP